MNVKPILSTANAARHLLLAAIACSLLILPGCGHKESGPGAAQTTAYGSAGAPRAALFKIPQEQMGHVQVIPVELQSFPVVLRLPGSVTYNAFQTTPVITQVSGPVSRVLVYPGQIVKAGQPMLYVSSPDFAQLRASYLRANDSYDLALANLKRDQDLYAHHAIAQMDVLQAQSTRNQALADLQSAEQALRVLGIRDLSQLTGDSTGAEIPVLAPIAGEVVERQVSPGQVVQAGATQVFTISNMGTVWVLVNVYQQDLAHVSLGDSVSVETDAYSTVFRGRISYIAPTLDPSTRTLTVRIVTRNPRGMLKKDMYVTAEVEAGKTKTLTVPNAAVLRNNENEPFVYVLVGANEFAQRLVTIGPSEDGQTQILSGLREGEKVVGDGSLFLQFARSLTS